MGVEHRINIFQDIQRIFIGSRFKTSFFKLLASNQNELSSSIVHTILSCLNGPNRRFHVPKYDFIEKLCIKLRFEQTLCLWVINLTRRIGKSDSLMIYLFFRSCFLAKLKKSLMSSNRHNLSKYKNRFSDKLQNASPVLTFRYFIDS